MALKRPPQHKIDATGSWIDPSDPAWDLERIEREKGEMLMAGDDPDDHPYDVYHRGDTRFDLEAKMTFKTAEDSDADPKDMTAKIRDYLKDTPTLFTLKRLSRRAYENLMALQMAGRKSDSIILSLKEGLKSVSGLEEFGDIKHTGISSKQLDYLYDVDPTLALKLSGAIILFSRGLTAGEN